MDKNKAMTDKELYEWLLGPLVDSDNWIGLIKHLDDKIKGDVKMTEREILEEVIRVDGDCGMSMCRECPLGSSKGNSYCMENSPIDRDKIKMVKRLLAELDNPWKEISVSGCEVDYLHTMNDEGEPEVATIRYRKLQKPTVEDMAEKASGKYHDSMRFDLDQSYHKTYKDGWIDGYKAAKDDL